MKKRALVSLLLLLFLSLPLAVIAAAPPTPVSEHRCGDGVCDGPENPQNCPQDCACGDGICDAAENPRNCPQDCPPTEGKCGDGLCDEFEQKNPDLCPQDCAAQVPTPTTAEEAASAPEPTPTPATVGAAWETVTLPSGEIARLGDPATVSQEGGAPGVARQANMAFILDASGSMNAELPGTGKTKLAVAKEVMSELIPQVPAEVNGSLWIYGHRYPQDPQEKSCQDIERVFALGPVDVTAYTQKINAINAIGYTPIADSIEQAARDLPVGEGQLNSIILVSDGEETCGGDPCALAEALKASDAAVTIHVVGYAVEEVAREQLQCIARVSGGTYHDAGLLQALEEAMAATVTETILRVEVVGPDGAEEHANVHLYEAGTDRRVSAYVAWKDNAVPPGSYDLLVDTLPWTLYRSLTIEEGSTTIVRIPLGAITVLTPDKEETTFDLYDATANVRLGYYGGTLFVVPGTYYVVVNNSTSEAIVVNAGETKELLLGAIRPLTPDGEETAVDFYDAVSGKRLGSYGGTVLLAPGTYYVVVNNSTSEAIAVEAGETEELLLGAI